MRVKKDSTYLQFIVNSNNDIERYMEGDKQHFLQTKWSMMQRLESCILWRNQRSGFQKLLARERRIFRGESLPIFVMC